MESKPLRAGRLPGDHRRPPVHRKLEVRPGRSATRRPGRPPAVRTEDRRDTMPSGSERSRLGPRPALCPACRTQRPRRWVPRRPSNSGSRSKARSIPGVSAGAMSDGFRFSHFPRNRPRRGFFGVVQNRRPTEQARRRRWPTSSCTAPSAFWNLAGRVPGRGRSRGPSAAKPDRPGGAGGRGPDPLGALERLYRPARNHHSPLPECHRGARTGGEKANLLEVTQVLSSLRYNDVGLLSILGGRNAMIESPLLQEFVADGRRKDILTFSRRVSARFRWMWLKQSSP